MFSAKANKKRVSEQKTGQNYFIFCFHKLLCATRCFDWLFSGSALGVVVDCVANRLAGRDVGGWRMVLPFLPAAAWLGNR